VLREENTKDLGVDRAYEAGEILALPRMIIESIVPPSSCNPRVRTVRFNLFSGAPLVQHSMTELTENLREAAAAPGANPSRVSGYRAAVECGDAGSRSYTASNNRLGL
jgi:hypothetical protein